MATGPKRVSLPRPFSIGRAFAKDWQRHIKAGRFDMARVKTAMLLLIANETPLPAEWRDHALSGKLAGYRDCHVHGDLLLLYRLEGEPEEIVFERLGSHSELF